MGPMVLATAELLELEGLLVIGALTILTGS